MSMGYTQRIRRPSQAPLLFQKLPPKISVWYWTRHEALRGMRLAVWERRLDRLCDLPRMGVSVTFSTYEKRTLFQGCLNETGSPGPGSSPGRTLERPRNDRVGKLSQPVSVARFS